jgi:hypothetical protein
MAPDGAKWRCRIKKREKDRRDYRRHREKRLAYVRAYKDTERGRAAVRRFRMVEMTRRREARINHYKEMTQ